MKFDLPDPGEGITEADLVEWKVSPGEAVEADQAVASVETDKAVVDIPVPEAGEIDSLLVDEGQTAIVGEPFLEYTPESEADQEAEQSEDNEDNTADETTDQTSEDEQALPPPTHPDKPIKAMPRVRQKAREHSLDLHDVAPTTTGRITLSDLNAYLDHEDTQPSDTHEEAQASESTDNTDAETQETETSTPKTPAEDKETAQEEDDASEEQDSGGEQPTVPDDFTTFKPESPEFNATPSQRGQSTTSNDAEHGSTGNTPSQSQTAEPDHPQSPERTGQEHRAGGAGTQAEQTPSTQLTDEAAEQAQDTGSPGTTTAEQREESSDPAKKDEAESEEDVGQTTASREDEEDQDIADPTEIHDAPSEPGASDSDAQRSESAQEPGEESTDKTETAKTETANKLNALSSTRAAIASNMRESLNTTAQTTITDEVDVTSLVKLHKAIKDDTDAPLTYLSYFVKAVTEALDEHQQFNATFTESGLQEHDDMNLGIAVDTDRGLFVPVLKNADHKGIENIAYSIRDLAERTRNNDNDPEDFQDATFTVSSLGSIAGQTFTPILNPPEVGILGIGEIKQRPRYHDGELVNAHVVHLSITIDHQVIDGADGARFLKTLRETLASPRELFPLQI